MELSEFSFMSVNLILLEPPVSEMPSASRSYVYKDVFGLVLLVISLLPVLPGKGSPASPPFPSNEYKSPYPSACSKLTP